MDSAEIYAPHDELCGWQDNDAPDKSQNIVAGGYYETRVKTAKQFKFVTYYIEQNPVVKGLVERPDDWDASSARRTDLVTDPWPWLLDGD